MALVLDGPNAGQEVEIPKDCVTVTFPYYPEKPSGAFSPFTYENPAETNYGITRYNRQSLRVEGAKQYKEFIFLSKSPVGLGAAEILEKLVSLATNKD